MENEVDEDILLHYKMFDYLYSLKALAFSCNNHCWEDFRLKHEQFKDYAADDLKKLFWSEIMPNIDKYQQIQPEMREYFETNKFVIESAVEDVASGKYEPKKDVDFKTWSSMSENASSNFSTIHEEFKASLKDPKTYKGSFGLDLDQPDANCLTICTTGHPGVVEDDEVDLIETFNEALRTQDDTGSLTKHEILHRLENPDIISRIENFKKLPKGVQMYMKQFPFFKDRLTQANQDRAPSPPDSVVSEIPSPSQISVNSSDKENTNRNSFFIPNVTSSSTGGENSSKSTTERTLRPLSSRASAAQSIRNLLEEETPKTTRPKQDPQRKFGNRRMENFMKNFSSEKQKRRRDSSSGSE